MGTKTWVGVDSEVETQPPGGAVVRLASGPQGRVLAPTSFPQRLEALHQHLLNQSSWPGLPLHRLTFQPCPPPHASQNSCSAAASPSSGIPDRRLQSLPTIPLTSSPSALASGSRRPLIATRGVLSLCVNF